MKGNKMENSTNPIKIQIAGGEMLSLKEQVQKLKGDLPYMLDMQRINAKIQWEAYDAYLKEGFNKEQAIYLIKR